VNRRCPLHCPYCSNPVNIGADRYRAELETEHWTRVFRQARALGVVRLALTGGEPMRRRDLDELVAAGRAAGRYSTLVTGGTRLTGERAERLKQAGLDHVQVSIQSPDPEDDRIAGNRSFEKKIAVARATRELGLPLTINCVLHRQNLDRIEELLALAEELDAQRLELANTHYYGWAVVNQQALLPTRAQLERGEEAVQRFRGRSTGSGTRRTRSRASAGRTGCRSRAARVRSGARRTGAAALPGASPHRRRGRRSRMPLLAAPRCRRSGPRVGARGPAHLPDDASARAA
jgi:PqqA peptide cyclase